MSYTGYRMAHGPDVEREVKRLAKVLRDASESYYAAGESSDVVYWESQARAALRAASSGEGPPSDLNEEGLKAACDALPALDWSDTQDARREAVKSAVRAYLAVDRVARPQAGGEAELFDVVEACAAVCESRARSLFHDSGRIAESNEAHKCAAAIRASRQGFYLVRATAGPETSPQFPPSPDAPTA